MYGSWSCLKVFSNDTKIEIMGHEHPNEMSFEAHQYTHLISNSRRCVISDDSVRKTCKYNDRTDAFASPVSDIRIYFRFYSQ